MNKRVALYVRVSTDDQTVENQLRELETVAERNEWNIVKIFRDDGISGSKGRDKQPGLDKLLKGVVRKDFDLVAVWSVDRVSRSLNDLLMFLMELQSKDCDLYLHKQALDTTTPQGRMMFQMLGVFAEFERAMIRERVKTGMARAKAEGKAIGRKEIPEETRAKIISLRGSNLSMRKIAKETGTALGTVLNVLKQNGGPN